MFHASFASAFTPDHELWHPRCLELEDHDCSTDQLPANLKLAQNLLLHLDACKSMGPNEIHPKILRELADVNMRSQLFSKGLGNLDSSQLTGSWQMFQFSRRGRKKILIVTDPTDSLQCLVKLCWELLKNTWRAMLTLDTANMGSWGEGPV